jgi:autotransporter adhesin
LSSGPAHLRTRIPQRLFDAREFSALANFKANQLRKNLAVASAITAAIAAASATPVATASAATASSTATTTMSAAITAASATPSATTAFSLRTSFIHYQRAAKEVFAIESCNRLFRCAVIVNLSETETARLSCKTIAEQRQRIRLNADLSEQRLHLLFCCFEREVPNVQFLHGRSPGPCKHGTHQRN